MFRTSSCRTPSKRSRRGWAEAHRNQLTQGKCHVWWCPLNPFVKALLWGRKTGTSKGALASGIYGGPVPPNSCKENTLIDVSAKDRFLYRKYFERPCLLSCKDKQACFALIKRDTATITRRRRKLLFWVGAPWRCVGRPC